MAYHEQIWNYGLTFWMESQLSFLSDSGYQVEMHYDDQAEIYRKYKIRSKNKI